MSPEQPAALSLEPRRQQAVTQLEELIRARYPTASFALRVGIDDPEATYITATVDVEDPDDVIDLVLDRLLELQLDEHIPIYVLPVHTPERVADTLRQVRRELSASAFLTGER